MSLARDVTPYEVALRSSPVVGPRARRDGRAPSPVASPLLVVPLGGTKGPRVPRSTYTARQTNPQVSPTFDLLPAGRRRCRRNPNVTRNTCLTSPYDSAPGLSIDEQTPLLVRVPKETLESPVTSSLRGFWVESGT